MKINSLKNVAGAHNNGIWAAAWSPATDSRPSLLITGSVDETVKLWKGDELELERTNTGWLTINPKHDQIQLFSPTESRITRIGALELRFRVISSSWFDGVVMHE